MFGKQLERKESLEANMILLAERMHWTLDYIEGLDDIRYANVLAVLDAWDKAKATKQ